MKKIAIRPIDQTRRSKIINTLIAMPFVLAIAGLFFVFEASYIRAFSEYGDSFHYLKVQAIWIVLGGCVMFLLSLFDYHKWYYLAFYAMLGSLGSHSINEHIFSLLESLLPLFVIIHQVGDVKEYGDLSRAEKLKTKYQNQFPNRYIPVSHVLENDIGAVYERAEFVIGRSGANTFFELIALQKPALFIPLPWSAHGEQKEHADYFKEHGIGEVFDQKSTSQSLYTHIISFHENVARYTNAFSSLPLQLKRDATQTLVQKILLP